MKFSRKGVSIVKDFEDINKSLDSYVIWISLISKRIDNLFKDWKNGERERLCYEANGCFSFGSAYHTSRFKNRIKNIKFKAVQSREKLILIKPRFLERGFLESIQKHTIVAANHRDQAKLQAERQYKLIRPDATEEEVKEVVEDDNEQRFKQALLQSNRRDEARAVLNNIRNRHREFLRLENITAELTQLSLDMEELVIERDQ